MSSQHTEICPHTCGHAGVMRHSSCDTECLTPCPVCLLFQSQQVSWSESLRKTFISYNFCLSPHFIMLDVKCADFTLINKNGPVICWYVRLCPRTAERHKAEKRGSVPLWSPEWAEAITMETRTDVRMRTTSVSSAKLLCCDLVTLSITSAPCACSFVQYNNVKAAAVW